MSIPLATHQFPTHIVCIMFSAVVSDIAVFVLKIDVKLQPTNLSSAVSPTALNSSAGTSSGPVALRLVV